MTLLTPRAARSGPQRGALLLAAALGGCGGGGTSFSTPSANVAAHGPERFGATVADASLAAAMPAGMPATQPDEIQAVSPLLPPAPSAGEVPEQPIDADDGEGLIPVAPDPAGVAANSDKTISNAVANSTIAAAKSLSVSDIIAELNPANTFGSLGWKWSIECGGQFLGVLSVPEAGITLNNLDDEYAALRFGKVPDPAAATRKVIFFRASRTDPLLYSAPRCEAGSSPTAGGAIPVLTPVWFAFGLRLHKWTDTADEQIVMQWHQGGDSIALNPFIAMSVMGSSVRVMARYNGNVVLSKATTTAMELSNKGPLPVDRWSYFVVEALISPDGWPGSYLKVWRDGVMTVNYSGPLGYRNLLSQPFVKVGHYHWIDRTNPWPDTTPTRTVLMRTPVLVRDAADRYAENDLRTHVMAR